ncbi:MAG: dynamin family protein [Pseudomonadota bacterium]
MKTFDNIKEETLRITSEILKCVDATRSAYGNTNEALDTWEDITSRVATQLTDDMVRVAVVGPIKSGKSTFINSFLEGDFLKRGAGVVTSIVTRIQNGETYSAKLVLKTWGEINTEIAQALVLFPSPDWRSREQDFDIRNETDRSELKQVLSTLKTDQLISHDTRDLHSVILAAYVEGYDRMKDMVGEGNGSFVYDADDFEKHKEIVGSGSRAIYLKDICLTIADQRELGKNTEISDCQGSDSPNPMHLAMIQDYLLQTHFIIYVITSRIGLRQADIRFLNLINKMGLLKNSFFVLNCDLSEHEDINNLKTISDKVQKELTLIHPDPPLFSFSSLYNLFKKLQAAEQLSAKDRLRLEQWAQDTEMLAFSDKGTERFRSEFSKAVTRERLSLLLGNNLERLSIVSFGLQDFIHINRDLLMKSARDARALLNEVDRRKDSIDNVISIITNTLEGTHSKLKRNLGGAIDHFFDPDYGKTIQEIFKFIKTYQAPITKKHKKMDASSFMVTLYLIFQEFQQALNRYLTESVNLEVVEFVKKQESCIKETIEGVCSSFHSMIQDALHEYLHGIQESGLTLEHQQSTDKASHIDIDAVKLRTNLKIPILSSNMQYGAQIKSEAIFQFGFYKILSFLKRAFKKKPASEEEKYLQLLHDRIYRIKKITRESLKALFMDYKENLKFQYLYKLVDAASDALFEDMAGSIRAFTVDLTSIGQKVEGTQEAKEQATVKLNAIAEELRRIIEQLEDMKRSSRGIVESSTRPLD